MHPERTGSIDIDTETRSFYRDLYGLDSSAYDTKIKPNLWGDLS